MTGGFATFGRIVAAALLGRSIPDPDLPAGAGMPERLSARTRPCGRLVAGALSFPFPHTCRPGGGKSADCPLFENEKMPAGTPVLFPFSKFSDPLYSCGV